MVVFLLAVLVAAQEQITYAVISVASNQDLAVRINGTVYPLTPSAESYILHKGEAPAASSYQYVKLKKGTTEVVEGENFERQVDRPIRGTTPNEFFGRNWNHRHVETFPSLGWPTRYNRGPSDLHPEGEIPTIHVTGPQSAIDNLHSRYMQDIDVQVNFTYISSNKIRQFSDVKMKLGGRSSRQYTKLAYNLNLPKGQDFEGFRKLKIRTTGNDPSYMREKLAYDMVYAAGVPASQASYIRLFINDRAIGLFVLAEKYDSTFLRTEFNGGNRPYDHGVLYRGEGTRHGRSSDLSYFGEDLNLYNDSGYSLEEDAELGPKGFVQLRDFTKFIDDQLQLQKQPDQDLNATVDIWEKRLDVETFIINMALEFLNGFWDGYLQNKNNYYLYQDPQQSRFIWMDWDLDFSMGSGPVNMGMIREGDYKKFAGVDSKPLMVAVLNIPHYRQLFEQRLRTILNELYDKSDPVIDSLAEFLREDIAWDQSLPRVRPGLSFLPGGKDILANLFHGNASDGEAASLPLAFDLLTAIDFIARVNKKIPFDNAINGPTGFRSLYGVKEWIRVKSAAVKASLQ
ncbi:coth protein-domain-containing protein [Radiomyces spectabilis]|uniref:coth protein-domain-containing protein n=1 Tax=Radiomyces spectabilis TaxID=64574 RepID=UPI00221EC048|nr:coth protein-domain-containing protein [Radiomyces spectabilis]KAI8393492.1 coth protein-domain-containing protein [Radiomyces spectabilis]